MMEWKYVIYFLALIGAWKVLEVALKFAGIAMGSIMIILMKVGEWWTVDLKQRRYRKKR